MKNAFRDRFKGANRARDFALYILISLVVLAAIAGLVSAGVEWNKLFKGMQFFFFPVVLLGTWIPGHRANWNERDFWLSLTSALLLHLVGFALIAGHYETLKPGLTSAVAFFECLAFVALKKAISRWPTRT